MSEKTAEYKLRFELACLVAIAFLIAFLMTRCDNQLLSSEIESLESEICDLEEENKNQFNLGYEAACDNMEFNTEYNEISDMNTDEIMEYLKSVTGDQYWSHEDAANFYVYGFQRGYFNRANGVWNDMTQEFIDGYEFSEEDIKKYSIFEWE